MKLSKILRDKYFLVLIAIIFLAILVAIKNLLLQTTFGYDMARDAYEAYSIFPGMHIKILGPGTDIRGLYHGVMWYYLLVIPYLIGQGDPQIAASFFFILTFATVPLVWLLAQRLFRDRRISFISVVLYSFSPIVQSFSSWMSNPIPGFLIAPVLLLFLWSYLEKSDYKKAGIIGICFGVLIQANLANLLFLLLIPIYLIIFKKKPSLKEFFAFCLTLSAMLFSYLLVELKFGWRGVIALQGFLQNYHSGSTVFKLGEIITKISDLFTITVFPFNNAIVFLILFLCAIVILLRFKTHRKQFIFLFIWLLNVMLFKFFGTGISQSAFVFGPSIAVVIILVGFVLANNIKNKKVLAGIVLLLVIFQVKQSSDWIKDEFSPMAVQRSNTVYRYKEIIDFTYKSAKGKPFIITSVTNPLFINTTWAYLYEFYGKKKYGYLPFWGGKSQIGYLGNLPEKPFGTKYRYLIIESQIGVPYVYLVKARYEEEKVSDLIEEKHFGYVIVQKRIFHENKGRVEIPGDLRNSPVFYE